MERPLDLYVISLITLAGTNEDMVGVKAKAYQCSDPRE